MPYRYNIIVLKNKNNQLKFEIYNLKKKIKILIHEKNFIYLDKNTNSIFFYKFSIKKNFNYLLSKLNLTLFKFEGFFFNKIKFKGKGFRIKLKKKNKILKLTFGHSHINYIFINKKNWVVSRINKYKYFFINKNDFNMRLFLKKLCNIKTINKYTKRGLRLFRQIVYKRKGKKSTYI